MSVVDAEFRVLQNRTRKENKRRFLSSPVFQVMAVMAIMALVSLAAWLIDEMAGDQIAIILASEDAKDTILMAAVFGFILIGELVIMGANGGFTEGEPGEW